MRTVSVCMTLLLLGVSVAPSQIQLPVSTEQQCPCGNHLLFRTKVGAVSFPAGSSQLLGTVDVASYKKIRVVADERVGSASNVKIRLTITEGSELVAQLDTLNLTPHSQLTRVYDAPGTKLSIYADGDPGAGLDSVDVLIYGSN